MKTRTLQGSLILVFVTVFLPAFLFAQHTNEPDSPCASPSTTADLVSCLEKARVSADAEMNSQYQKTKARLDAKEVEQLIATQRLWIKYRDANCSAERSLYVPGSGAPPAYIGCLEAMTRERTKELQVTYRARLKE
jgi:uncharacterized protein YecT (DUF1311 family)